MSKIEKIKEMDLVSVDNARIKQVIDTYFHWKQLDAEIKTLSGTRGINFPSELSEYMACYALGLMEQKLQQLLKENFLKQSSILVNI